MVERADNGSAISAVTNQPRRTSTTKAEENSSCAPRPTPEGFRCTVDRWTDEPDNEHPKLFLAYQVRGVHTTLLMLLCSSYITVTLLTCLTSLGEFVLLRLEEHERLLDGSSSVSVEFCSTVRGWSR